MTSLLKLKLIQKDWLIKQFDNFVVDDIIQVIRRYLYSTGSIVKMYPPTVNEIRSAPRNGNQLHLQNGITLTILNSNHFYQQKKDPKKVYKFKKMVYNSFGIYFQYVVNKEFICFTIPYESYSSLSTDKKPIQHFQTKEWFYTASTELTIHFNL